MSIPKRVTARTLTLLILGWASIHAQQPASPFPARLADKVLLHDTATSAGRLLVVGDRGTILQVRNGRLTQILSPVDSMLTGISTRGDLAWAVGHDGTILRSTDAGESWTIAHYNEGERDDIPVPWTLLDVHFYDETNGLAVGSFGLIMRTSDAGKTWSSTRLIWAGFDEDLDINEMHLYRLSIAEDGTTWLAADEGEIFRSADRGKNWTRVTGDYFGALFDIHAFDRNTALTIGIQGTLLRTSDGGKNWQEIDCGVRSILHGIIASPEKLWLVGYGGKVLVSRDRGLTWKDVSMTDRIAISGGIHTDTHKWLLTQKGLRPFSEVGP